MKKTRTTTLDGLVAVLLWLAGIVLACVLYDWRWLVYGLAAAFALASTSAFITRLRETRRLEQTFRSQLPEAPRFMPPEKD